MSPQLPGRPRYLAFLPDFLFVADDKARYVVKAWLLALLPTFLLSIGVDLLFPQADSPEFAFDGPLLLFSLVVAAPFLETLLMIPPLLLLDRWAGPGPAVVASAVSWGVVHSLEVPVWGLVAWWPFLVLSIAFLTWRAQGIGIAILLVTVIHGLHNSVFAAMLLVAPAG